MPVGIRKLFSVGLVSLGVLAGGLALASAPALAGEGFAFVSSFAPPSGFGGAAGIAVSEAGLAKGDVYVADYESNQVDRFSATGAWESVVASLASANPYQVTVDDNTGSLEGDVYVAGAASDVVYRLSPALAVEQEIKGFERPQGVAVDAAGDVFVAESNGKILEFNSAGEPVDPAGAPSSANVVAEGLANPQAVAVDPSGDDLYVANENGPTVKFALSSGAYKEVDASFDPSGSKGVTVAPSGNVFVDRGGEFLEYEPTGTLVGLGGAGRLSNSFAVAVDAGGTVYGANFGGEVDIFEPGPTPQTPVTEAAEVKGVAVTFHGTLKPPATKLSYYFQYNAGASCSGGSQTPSEEGEGAVFATASLQPQTQYTVCLVAENKYGLSEPGGPETFTTGLSAPIVESEGFSNVKASEARLEAQVNPESEVTVCQFQYEAEEPLLATPTPTTTLCEPGALAASFGGQGVGLNLSGLESGKTYYYRAIAENEQSRKEGKPGEGKIEHFTTATSVETPEAKPANPIGATGATLNGVLNPNGKRESEPGSAEFRYRQSATECEGENEKLVTATETLGSETLSGHKEEAVKASVTELLPNTQYTFCVLARNDAGEESLSSPETVTTHAQAPSVTSTTLSHLSSTGVTVEGQIAPGGLETSYSVQYGTSTAYESHTTPVSISPSVSSATVAVTVPLTELAANTAYHLRLVVSNTAGKEAGGDVSFTTYAAGTSVLPDGRVYEMVTPPENYNANVFELGEGSISTHRLFQAAADGNSVAYVAQPATGGNGSTGTGNAGNEYLATRSPQGGWNQVNVTPAGSSPETLYQAFSSDLSIGFLTTGQEAPFVASPTLGTLREGVKGYPGLYSHAFDEGLYRPVFTTKPPYRARETKEHSEVLGGGNKGGFGSAFENAASEHAPLYAGSSANVEDQLFEANDALLAGEGPPELEEELDSDTKKEVEGIDEALKLQNELNSGNLSRSEHEKKGEEIIALEAVAERNELYESVGGRLSLVNVLPNGTLSPGATFGGQQTVFDGLVEPGSEREPDFSHDISADGSRIFWTALENTVGKEPRVGGGVTVEERPGVVYVRENGTRTVAVSQGPAEFWTASDDGKYAFYTEAGGLWRFDVEDGTRMELAGEGVNPGEEAGMQAVVGVNETGEDGAYVYFVADGVLTKDPNSQGEIATERACEPSYLSAPAGPAREHAEFSPEPGEPYYEELHGRLPAGYGCNLYVLHGGETKFIATLSATDGGDWVQALGGRVSNITPDGQTLVFSAVENLTGTPHPSEGAGEVYVYDTSDGSLVCASCRPQASGGHLPTSASLVYTYRRVSEDGDQVFFDSDAPLVSRDVNGAQDVYEWERDGSGGCTETAGCVYLLSGGVEGSAYLVDASVSGNDVFFAARQKLVPEDGDENVNLYDARVDGVPPVAPAECSGTGCQGVPAPAPIFATPASATVTGVDDFPPPAPPVPVKSKPKAKTVKCKKGYVKKKGKCVRKPKPKKQRAKAKKASDDGRASR